MFGFHVNSWCLRLLKILKFILVRVCHWFCAPMSCRLMHKRISQLLLRLLSHSPIFSSFQPFRNCLYTEGWYHSTLFNRQKKAKSNKKQNQKIKQQNTQKASFTNLLHSVRYKNRNFFVWLKLIKVEFRFSHRRTQ